MSEHANLLRRHRAVMPSWMALNYQDPIEIVGGKGNRVTDAEGNGYLDFFTGILTNMIDVDAKTGQLTLKDTCLVAGLGANPYRDGSYEYYLREPRVSNDPKGMAPFILASLELEGRH